jgi:hypothetical protein
MHKLFIVLAVAVIAPGFVAAADADDALKVVHQFVDGFNKGDTNSALAACAGEGAIIDEFPPYFWSGTDVCAKWAADYEADSKKKGITDGVVTLGKPRHVDVAGDRAYLVAPTTYTFKQKGKPVRETNATLTVALHKEAAGWRMTSWSWSKP